MGSSAGAFRAACFAQADPVAAIERLATDYSGTRYSDNVTPEEITTSARELLDRMLGDNGIEEIINNPVFRAHFIVARVQGLGSIRTQVEAAYWVIQKLYRQSRKSDV